MQIEDIDFDETFSLIKRLEAIKLLGISCFLKFKLCQIDVKDAFLSGYLNEKCLLNNQKGLLILLFLNMYTNSIRLCIG